MAKGGTWVFVAVLVGAVALANNGSSTTSSSSNTSSSSAQGFSFDLGSDSHGGTCNHTSSFTTSKGRYTIPSNGDSDAKDARDCMLDQDQGSGAPVSTLQQALDQCNGAHLAVDGDYGSATAAAVKSFQSGHGLTADGKYGPATAGKLSWPTTNDSGKSTCAVQPV
ncbi:MAG TPA: peptidoglycan-binding domain-containing protein [Acidimicrobiales bacterium]|nr:peptidoglycan-binding domain-containing protein [Acidimicrobiales bacterium]